MELEDTIPDDKAEILRTILKLRPGDSIPPEVVDRYDQLRRALRSVGYPVTPHDLAWLVVFMNWIPPDPPHLVTEDAGLKKGDRLIVFWRNEWKWARYQGNDPKKPAVLVVIDDDPENQVRSIHVTKSRRPSLQELKSVEG